MLESETCPLGILEYQQFETSQSEWGNGDIIVLYTDGIIEAQNGEQEDFGEERLKQLIIDNVHLSPVKLKETILHELESFCQGTDQADDVSLVIVKMGARDD
jgi:sigma-B regulation protein RsbU (phosphoserine phosphatase)